MAESLRGPSRTAVLVAVVRDVSRQDSVAVIFDDNLAPQLAGEEGSAISGRLEAEIDPTHIFAFSRWLCIRSRYTEDLVEQAIDRGIDQYVILGAGLDSFAYRRSDLGNRVRVFEVDHPGSQGWKRRRLRELAMTIPDNLVFAPVDFEHESLQQALLKAGFDFGRPAAFSWVGVTMYLTLDAIEATLSTIAQCPAGSGLVLTYNQPPDTLDELSKAVTTAFMSIATEMGEPFKSLFAPPQIDALLRSHGFDDIVDLGHKEARSLYFEGQPDLEIAGAQRLAAANVGRKVSPTPDSYTGS